MKYDDMKISDSYNYEHENIVRGKTHQKRRFNPLDVAVVCSIFAVIISTAVLVSKLMQSGLINSVMNTIA